MINNERQQIEQAVAALQAQRALLGDAVVETALGPLLEKLAALKKADSVQPQRKIVSILFADLSGFTSLSETLDVEDVAGLINQLWQKVDQVLLAHGGQIDKHIGDAVMALWGAEVGREDDAEQSIRAALAIQAEIENWHATSANPLVARLKLRIGVNTGPVLLGTTGSKSEYTAMGDTVNVAARLVEMAPSGAIIIAHASYRHVRGLFEVLAQPLLKIKGKLEAVQTYQVISAKPRSFRLQTRGVEGIETRMVGRSAELEALKHTLQTVLAQNAWRAVTVLAEAGMGKSRLLYEFNTWTELLPKGWRLFKGRADETMTRSPYALWRDVFSFRFNIQNSDGRELACAKLEQGMATLLPDDPRSQEIAHLLGHLVGLDFSSSPHLQALLSNPAQFQAQARAALVHLFSTLSSQAPVALQLEDIHWADDGSLDLLEYLLSALPPSALLLGIWLARPILLERRPQWCAFPAHSRLQLKPLSAEESGQLAGEILQKIPQPLELQRLVVENAAGNPFYLEELIKMLIDEGAITAGEETWSINQSRLQGLQVPATLTGILQARLDNLSRPERLALQCAAILGQIFWDDAVRHLVKLTADNLPAGTLAGVQSKELIYSRQPAAFSGTREFGFKHAILRDVTYNTVLKRDRPALHALAAEWLAQHSSERLDEFAPLIADHYEQAGDFLQAAQYLNRVARRAHALSSYDESLAALERLIGLLENNPQPEAQDLQLAARVRIGEIYGRGLDAYAEARVHLEAALKLAQKTGNSGQLAAALGQLGWVAYRQGDFAQTRVCFNQALPLVRALGDTHQEIYLTRQLGNLAFAYGDWNLTQQYFEESLAIARSAGAVDGEAHAQASLGLVYQQRDDHQQALHQFQLGLQLFRQIGERRYITTALSNLANTYLNLGQYAESRQCAAEALSLAQQIGSVQSIAGALLLLAQIAWQENDRVAAHAQLYESILLQQSIGEIPDMLECLVVYARWLAGDGRSQQAAQLLNCVRAHPSLRTDILKLADEALAQFALDLSSALPLSLEEAVRLIGSQKP